MPLLLDTAPQLLSLLRRKEGDQLVPLSKEQVQAILDEQTCRREESAKPENKGKDMGSTFAGEIAVEFAEKEGVESGITRKELNRALGEQARLYAAAALNDINVIAEKGAQTVEIRKDKDGNDIKGKDGKSLPVSTPFWNIEAGKDLSIESAALNAAHMARSMALLANQKGDKALAEKLVPSVEAAAELAAILSDPEQAKKLSKEDMHKLRDEAKKGLKEAMEKTGQKLKGPDGEEMSVDDYLTQLSESMDMAYAAHHGKAAAAPVREQIQAAAGGASHAPFNRPRPQGRYT